MNRRIVVLVWIVMMASIALSCVFAFRWYRIATIDARIRDGDIDKIPSSTNPAVRYAVGWRAERSLRYADAVQAYSDASLSGDSQAWFALGNAYFKIGIAESRDYEAKAGMQQENAQFDLAREAYRSALRIDPGLRDARYNLELLERLSPVRHLQGWRRNTDPIMLVPDKHNGWTSMQDDKKRGLP